MEKARGRGGDNGGKLGWILNFSQVTDFIIFEKVNAGEGGNDGHGPFSFAPAPRKAARESIVPTKLTSLSLCNDASSRYFFSRNI